MPTVIVPVGLHLGADFALGDPGAKVPTRFHVALGSDVEALDASEMKVWAAVFLDPKRHAKLEVTRAAVARYLVGAKNGLQKPDEVIDALLERGLLVEFDPVEGPLEGVFSRYNILPSAEGLGATARDPYTFRIGHNSKPAVAVDETVFYLWAFSRTKASVWDACAYAADDSEWVAEGNEPLGDSTEDVAKHFAAHIPMLVSNTCAVLQPV